MSSQKHAFGSGFEWNLGFNHSTRLPQAEVSMLLRNKCGGKPSTYPNIEKVEGCSHPCRSKLQMEPKERAVHGVERTGLYLRDPRYAGRKNLPIYVVSTISKQPQKYSYVRRRLLSILAKTLPFRHEWLKCKSHVARANYLAMGRIDIQHCARTDAAHVRAQIDSVE